MAAQSIDMVAVGSDGRHSATRHPARFPVVVLLAFLASVLGCDVITSRPEARETPSIRSKVAADATPAWAHDGRTIAYHRRFPSTDGPPGIYIVPSAGGTPRLVLAGDFGGPERLRFSPDDKALAADWRFQLLLVDVASGAIRRPLYTDNGVNWPDWSPDGRLIAYTRLFRQSSEPADSGGIHILDLASGEDRPVVTGDGVLTGGPPRWSPDGRFLVNIEYSPMRIVRVTPDGSEHIALVNGSVNDVFGNPQWVTDPIRGRLGVLFNESHGGTRRAYYVSADGAVSYKWHLDLAPWDVVSPDGRTLAFVYPQVADSVPVLFTRQVFDATGVSRRQLTHFRQ
jgi:Tol biopolymer transport system component